MVHTYGPFHLSNQEIIGIALVAVLILIAAMVTLRLGHKATGIAFSFASGILLLMVVVTTWDILEQTSFGMAALFWVMLETIGGPILWLTMLILSAFPNLLPKRKLASKSRS